jgi:hypothetical protein
MAMGFYPMGERQARIRTDFPPQGMAKNNFPIFRKSGQGSGFRSEKRAKSLIDLKLPQ